MSADENQKRTDAAALSGSFGRYEILEQVGRGGMGAVYKARDTQLDRIVALKTPFIAPDASEEIIDRFLREARAMASMRHPNLCPVYDVGEEDGVHYLTMAFIEGVQLKEWLTSQGDLSAKRIAELTRKLALALEAET